MHTDSDKITLTQATKRIPGRPDCSTVWRWVHKGVRAADGTRVYLKAWRYGGRLFTSVEEVERFAEILAERDREHYRQRDEDRLPSSAERRREIGDVKRKSAEAGILE